MENSNGKQNGTWSIDHTPPDGPRTHTHVPILHRHATGDVHLRRPGKLR